jgi:hypothetical protein
MFEHGADAQVRCATSAPVISARGLHRRCAAESCSRFRREAGDRPGGWPWVIDRLRRPGARRALGASIGYAALAGFELYWNGIVVMSIGFLVMAVWMFNRGYRLASSAAVEGGHGEARMKEIRPVAIFAFSILTVAALLTVDRATIGGRPLFAGPALIEVRAAGNSTAGSDVADAGKRFVVFDVVMASHLGARLRHVYYGDFRLEIAGSSLRPALGPSQSVPEACDGLDVPRWSSRRCRVVFEIPTDAHTARLHFKDLGRKAHSGDIDLRKLPQAEVPRVEVRTRVGARGSISSRNGLERVRVFVRAEALGGAAPVSLGRLRLAAVDGSRQAYDISDSHGIRNACADEVVDGIGTCVAEFDIPADAGEALLTLTTYHKPLPGAERSAGVTLLHF